MNQGVSLDEQYLQLLSIFHYVIGGIAALFASIPLIHLALGVVFLMLGLSAGSDETMVFAPIGAIFIVIAGSMILLGWTFALCMILAGRFLTRRTHYMFCLVMSGFSCIFVPFGTVLGVFTIITLTKSSVKEMFAAS